MLVTTILPDALVDKIQFVSKLDVVRDYRKEMIPKYQEAIKKDSRGLIPDKFKTNEDLNFLLASNMMDSLLFAGGLSVPSAIGVSMRAVYIMRLRLKSQKNETQYLKLLNNNMAN